MSMVIMKRIAILFAAVSVLLPVMSCQKESQPSEKRVKVQIEVSDLEPGTKAIKTGWVEGDKINIWFGNAYWSVVPQLVLTRTATGWDSSEVSEPLLSANPSGTFKAVYEASNSLFASAINSQYAYYPTTMGRDFSLLSTNDDGLARYMPLTCYAQNIAYTYDSEKKELTASINNWEALTRVQVVVTGLTGDPDRYVMTFGGDMLYYSCIAVNNTGAITDDGYGLCNGVDNASNWALGTSNPDGVAFYFGHHSGAHSENWTYSLYLLDRSTSNVYRHSFTVPFSKINSGFIFAVKTPFSSFAEYTN